MIVDTHGYLLGNLIAIAACSGFFYAGTLYEAHMAPEPCSRTLPYTDLTTK
jgi:hypothetical protein